MMKASYSIGIMGGVTKSSFVKLPERKYQCQCSQGIWGLSPKYLLRVKNLSPKYLLQIKTSTAHFREGAEDIGVAVRCS